MEEKLYMVRCCGCMIAAHMRLDGALILVKGYVNEYYNDSLSFEIMEETETRNFVIDMDARNGGCAYDPS